MSHLFLNQRSAAMFTPRGVKLASRVGPHNVNFSNLQKTMGECGLGALEYKNDDGVAVIDVKGGIVSEQLPMWFFYGDVTYENIVLTVQAAVNDAAVHAIMLRFNSPGGTVTSDLNRMV